MSNSIILTDADYRQYIARGFTKALPMVKTLTNDNDHTGALILAAQTLRHTRAANVLLAAKKIRDIEGEVTPELDVIIKRWRENLLTYTANRYPELVNELRKSI